VWGEVRSPRDRACGAPDGRRVPSGHPVTEIERVKKRAHQAELEAGELGVAAFELLRAALGEKELADEILERHEDDAEQRDRRKPDLEVEIRNADRE
jgi:hypothetical protein